MKRTTAILLSALMLLALAACGQQPAASAPEATPEPAQAPTPVPTPTPTPEPTPIPTEAAAVLLDRVGAVARLYDLGEKVKVVGADEAYYTLSDGLLVERWLIRLDTEEAPQSVPPMREAATRPCTAASTARASRS